MKQRIARFKRRVRAQMPSRGRGRRFPAALRSEAVAITVDAVDAGWEVPQVAKELGVNTVTLKHWVERTQETERFPPILQPVAVVEPETKETQVRVVVHGPSSLRVEGLGLDELAVLWRKLS
jgi:transposase-like protein